MTQLKMTLSGLGVREAIVHYLSKEYNIDVELTAVNFSHLTTLADGFEASLFLDRDADQLELPLEESKKPPFEPDDPAIPFK